MKFYRRLGLITLICLPLLFLLLNGWWTRALIFGAIYGHECQENLIASGQERLKVYLGRQHSNPFIFCLSDGEIGPGIEYGQASFAPLMPSVVLLGPSGQNVDVLSHELMHAELSQRVGFFVRTYRLPTWFDEGLAMQVDTRPDYGRNALAVYQRRTDIRLSTLDDIQTASTFYDPSDQGKYHYALSKCVLAAWLRNDPRNLFQTLAKSRDWSEATDLSALEAYSASCQSSD